MKYQLSKKNIIKQLIIPLVLFPVMSFSATSSFGSNEHLDADKNRHCKNLYSYGYTDLAERKHPSSDCANRKYVEDLDRGLVVIPSAAGNVLSWRSLQTDSPQKRFNVFRNGKKINKKPLRDETFFVDKGGRATDRYWVASEDGYSTREENAFTQPWSKPYLGIPLNKPQSDSVQGVEFHYTANDASVADLDGDGRYEIIVKWNPGNAKDNAQSGYTGNVFIDAYTLDGTQLWRIDLGRNIRAGAHYTQFIAYDFDGDGRAEIAMKTADATVDGRGNVIGDADADHRNSGGYILTGPEYLTMFDGLSGEALDTIDYLPPRGDVGAWGDTYGNRVDRFLAGVAYLDGQRPSLLMARGYYTRAVVAAFDWADGHFSKRWVFDTNNGGGDEAVHGQGAHSLTIGDVDGDGRDEIVYGAATIDDNGQVLYSTGLGHGDAEHLTDIDPTRPGMEIFMVHESPSAYTKDGIEYGVELHDAATGEILWQRPTNGGDIGRGVSFDVDPRFIGNEHWASSNVVGMVAADGTLISQNRPAQINFGSWWDGDLLRELLDKVTIYKWDYQNEQSVPLLQGGEFNAVSNNGTKATPSVSADIFGDWREEVVWANADSTELMIFSTTIPTQYRIPTLMQNPQYRVAIAWQNTAYNQPPHPDFYLGAQTEFIPDYKTITNEGTRWSKLVAHGYEDKIVIRLYNHKVNIKGAEIFRTIENDPTTKRRIGYLRDDKTELVDTDVVPDVNYYYWAKVKGSSVDPGVSKAKLSTSLIPQVEFNILNDKVPVQLAWRTENMDIRKISIYRAETIDANSPANFADSQLVGSPASNLLVWQDSSATASKNYYYWIEFDNAVTNTLVLSEPVYVATVLTPLTNLTSTHTDGGISLSWDLQNFAKPIRVVELYRNTANTATGRSRLSSNVPHAGTFLDTLNLVPGTTYWYMFKIIFTDGTTGGSSPEAMITY